MFRRRFLSALSAAGLFSASGLFSDTDRRFLLSTPANAAQTSSLYARRWQVIVVGSGLAGLTAALSAVENGAEDVLVIEKLPILGGHSRLSLGTFCGISPRRLAPLGIRTSIDDALKEALRVGGSEANEDLLRVLLKESESAMDWLEGHGLIWNEHPSIPVGSDSIYAFLPANGSKGLALISAVNQKAREAGVHYLFSHRVTDLLLNDFQSRVDGVVTRTPDGRVQYIRAKSVVLATGGFAANPELCQSVNKNVKPGMPSTANPKGKRLDGATGDALSITAPLKAKVVGLEHIQLICYSGGRLLDYAGADIYVNSEGRRFVNEAAPFTQVEEALLKQPLQTLWALTDGKSVKNLDIENKIAEGSVRKFDSVAEVAKFIGCRRGYLEATLERYNLSVQQKFDVEFGKQTLLQTIDTPPFYVGLERLGIHFCSGGIGFNRNAEVIREDGLPIPGLYIAGEASGGMHGKDRISGGALTECVVFGRIAGKEAALSALFL